MPCIDFREIPEAHITSGNQDTFELFARDFFSKVLKFNILSEPSRGADGGKDILVEEIQTGTLSETRIVWLVSCKHKAHSGNSVTPDDETNISDRLEQFNADGFIGFYSTVPSSGLNNRLDSYKGRYRIQIFDKERIEALIIDRKMTNIFQRYFPNSYQRWVEAETRNRPSNILNAYHPLKCSICGRDLLDPSRSDHGIIVFASEQHSHKIIHAYAVCRGTCDDRIENRLYAQGLYSCWDDISDLMKPTIFLQRMIAVINQFRKGPLEFEPDGLTEYLDILIMISQYVFRNQSESDLERIHELSMIPEGL